MQGTVTRGGPTNPIVIIGLKLLVALNLHISGHGLNSIGKGYALGLNVNL